MIWFRKDLVKGTFFSESTDVIVITPNKRTFYFPETENLIFGDIQGCPKAVFLPLSLQTLRHPQFQSNFQSQKFKFSVSEKKNVRLLGVMTKTSVSSDKNVPLIYFYTLSP